MAGNAESRLLRSAGSGEANCQNRIHSWLCEKGIEQVEACWRTSAGTADLYLPNRRCIIEVKSAKRLRGGPHNPWTGSPSGDRPGESAYEQVERYVLAERKRPRLHLDYENMQSQSWLGIVTDGRRWWIWEWPPTERGCCNRTNLVWTTTRLTKQNVELLTKLIKRKIGVEWALTNPASLQRRLEDYAHTAKIQVLRLDCLAF